jgi:hypothetical protein
VGEHLLQRLHEAPSQARGLPDEPKHRSGQRLHVLSTDEEANLKADGWTFFAFALRYYSTHVPGEPGVVNLWEQYQAFRRSPEGRKMHAGGLIGSPETIRAKLLKFEASHLDQVILLNQAGRNANADICSSLELFASNVMPEFVARDGAHQEWKRSVLTGETVLDEVDTSPDVLPRPERRPIETQAKLAGLRRRFAGASSRPSRRGPPRLWSALGGVVVGGSPTAWVLRGAGRGGQRVSMASSSTPSLCSGVAGVSVVALPRASVAASRSFCGRSRRPATSGPSRRQGPTGSSPPATTPRWPPTRAAGRAVESLACPGGHY